MNANQVRLHSRVVECTNWINAVYPEAQLELGSGSEEQQIETFYNSIEDGKMLCNLINKLNINNVSCKVRTLAKPKSFPARDNLQQFLLACTKLGVPAVIAFEVDDLALRKNDKLVVSTLVRLAQVVESQVPAGAIKYGAEASGSKLAIVDNTVPVVPAELTKVDVSAAASTARRMSVRDISVPSTPATPAVTTTAPATPAPATPAPAAAAAAAAAAATPAAAATTESAVTMITIYHEKDGAEEEQEQGTNEEIADRQVRQVIRIHAIPSKTEDVYAGVAAMLATPKPAGVTVAVSTPTTPVNPTFHSFPTPKIESIAEAEEAASPAAVADPIAEEEEGESAAPVEETAAVEEVAEVEAVAPVTPAAAAPAVSRTLVSDRTKHFLTAAEVAAKPAPSKNQSTARAATVNTGAGLSDIVNKFGGAATKAQLPNKRTGSIKSLTKMFDSKIQELDQSNTFKSWKNGANHPGVSA